MKNTEKLLRERDEFRSLLSDSMALIAEIYAEMVSGQIAQNSVRMDRARLKYEIRAKELITKFEKI